jgi:hypothetical protein
MVTLREAVQKALADIDAMPYWNAETLERIESDLRQALAADTKPCACCGDGKASISVTRICDTCGSEYAGREEMDAAKRIEARQQAEPVAWECKAGGLKRLTQHQYEAQSDAIKRHYTRIQPAQQPLTEEKIADLFGVACRETFSGLERFIYFTRLVESFHNIK